MRAFVRTVTIAAVLLSLAGMARAAEIRVLSVGAVQNAVKSLADDFARESGHQVIFTIGSPVIVMQKIKDGETFDAVIVSEPAMDQLDKEGTVNPESRVRLANTGMGVAVRDGAPLPDLSTPDAFKAALLAAISIVYGDPTLPNQSGEKAERILLKAGLLETLSLVQRELNPRLTVAGMLLTMHDGRTRLGQDVEREVRAHFPDLVFDTVIPRNVRVGEAPSYGLPVTHHDPHSAGAEAYFELAKEVAARG